MAPRGTGNWRRPYTTIYNDNYRYGNSLYSDTLSDIERRYADSLSRTQLRSDRPDLGLSTFAGSTLTSSPNPAATSSSSISARPLASSPRPSSEPKSTSASKDISFPSFESRLNTAFYSSYLTDDFEPMLSSTERRARSLEAKRPRMPEDHPLFSTLPKVSEKPELEDIAEESISRKKTSEKTLEDTKVRKKAIENITGSTSPTGGSAPYWKDKCRDLQEQVDELTHAMANTGSKVRDEILNLKGKFHTELNDLVVTVEQTSRQCGDLQRTVKSQENQLLELQSAYDDVQRRLQDSQEEVGTWQRRCQQLRKEMTRMRAEMDEATHASSRI